MRGDPLKDNSRRSRWRRRVIVWREGNLWERGGRWVLAVVYYKSINRELKKRCMYECRCDGRLQTKTKELHVSLLIIHWEWVGRGTGTPKGVPVDTCLL